MANLEKNSDEIIYSEIKQRLANQSESIRSVDTKASLTLTFVGAILAGLVNSVWFIGLKWYYHLAILLSLGVTAAFSLVAVLVRTYRADPDPSGLINNYANKSEVATRGQLIKNMQDSFDKNEATLKDKVKYLKLCFGFLALAVLILGLSIFLSLHKITIN